MQSISEEIRSATTSMTSVPKPLKFLRKHYDSVKTYYESMPDSDNKPKLADVLSILAISSAVSGSRESLRFRLAGSKVCLKPVRYIMMLKPPAMTTDCVCIPAASPPVLEQSLPGLSGDIRLFLILWLSVCRMLWRLGATSMCATWLPR